MSEPHKFAYTVDEAVKLTPFGRTRLYEVINSGELPSRVKGRRRYIMHDDLMTWLRSDDQEQAA